MGLYDTVEKAMEKRADKASRTSSPDSRECIHYPNKLKPVKGSNPLKLKCTECGATVRAFIL